MNTLICIELSLRLFNHILLCLWETFKHIKMHKFTLFLFTRNAGIPNFFGLQNLLF